MSFYNIKDGNFGNHGKFYTHEQLNFNTTYLHITKLIGSSLYPQNSDIIMMPDLSKFINLEELTYEVKLEDTPTRYEDLLTIELNKTILDLSKCVQIKRITLINVGQKMLDNLNLNNCIQLTDFDFRNDNYIKYKMINDLYLNKINFSKNIYLKNINYVAVVKDDLYNKNIYKRILPDLSHNIHLTSYSFNIYNGINAEIGRLNQITGEPVPFNIQDHLELFPRNLTEFSREGLERLRSRVERREEENRLLKIKDDGNKKILQQHESLIESKFNKLEKEIEARIKDEESFRLLMDRRFHQLGKQLGIKDETYTREQIKTEERLNKLEEENRLLKIKDDENKKILQQQESVLTLIVSKFNKLEEDNRELRKIIDDLRPTKSSFM